MKKRRYSESYEKNDKTKVRPAFASYRNGGPSSVAGRRITDMARI